MMTRQIGEIAGKLTSYYQPMGRMVIDVWHDFGNVTIAEFRALIMEKSIPYAQRHDVRTWIVDASRAEGALSQRFQTFLRDEVVHRLADAGIEYFISVAPANSLARLSTRRYTLNIGPGGMELIEARSLEDALELAKLKASA